MRIAIIDDEEQWRISARNYVYQRFSKSETVVEEFSSGEAFVRRHEKYEIVLADIEMPGLDGFETIGCYGKEFPEAICMILTTHTELSRRGYMVNAFRYIDKLSMEAELTEALDSAAARLKMYETISVNVVGVGEMGFVIKDIFYIETEKRNVLIHAGNQVYCSSNTISQLEEELQEYGFYRCHKSYLVNLSCIRELNRCEILLRNGDRIQISPKRVAELKETYYSWKIRNANR